MDSLNGFKKTTTREVRVMKRVGVALITGASAAVLATTISPTPGHAQAYEAGTVTGGGSIVGKVVFNGAVPTKKVIPTKDVDLCGGPYEEKLVEVGPDKGVQEAVVYLAQVAKGKAWPAQAKPPEVDNVKCKFVPHIQVI